MAAERGVKAQRGIHRFSAAFVNLQASGNQRSMPSCSDEEYERKRSSNNKKRPSCSVDGCSKESQGRSNRHMPTWGGVGREYKKGGRRLWDNMARAARAAKAAREQSIAVAAAAAAPTGLSSPVRRLSPSPRQNGLDRKPSAATDGEGVTLVHAEPAVPEVASKCTPTRLDEDDDFSSKVVSIAFGESRTSADDEVHDLIQRDVLSRPAVEMAAQGTDQKEGNKTGDKEDGEDVRHDDSNKRGDCLWELKGLDLGEAMPSLPSTPVSSSRLSSGEGFKEGNSSTQETSKKKNASSRSTLPAIDELEEEGSMQGNEADHVGAPGKGAALTAVEDKTALKEAVSLSPRSRRLTTANMASLESQIPRESISHGNSSRTDASPLIREGVSKGEKAAHTSKKQVVVRQSASSAGNKSILSAQYEGELDRDSVFDFEPKKKSMSQTKKKSPPRRQVTKRSSSGRWAEPTASSPSRKRKRRLTEQIEQALSPSKKEVSIATTSIPLSLQSPLASSTSSEEEAGNYVDFSECLRKVHSTDVQGPYAPGRAPSLPPSLRSSSNYAPAASLFRISDAPPPRRVQYRNQKTLHKPTHYISTSLTNMNAMSATASSACQGSTSICYWKTLGRCHIKEDSDSGFQWCKKSTNVGSFISSDFLGYNEGLGRVYFSSFFHRDRKIQVGSFVKRRTGDAVDYFRVVGVYQATKSFGGYWGDGAVVMQNASKSKKGWNKEQIQKRGHPYLIGVPLRLKSDVESGKARKALKKGRKKNYIGSDTDTDIGFTSCDSEGDSGFKMGTTRRKRQKRANGIDAQIHEEEVQQELVLDKGAESPNHIWMLPEWLGIEGVTLEVIDVAVQNEIGEQKLVKGSEVGSKRRARSSARGNFVCRRALTKELWKIKKPRTKKGAKKAPLPDPFSRHLSDDQFTLLTSPPMELLKDSIPLTWDVRFEAAQIQFIQEDRDWLSEDKPSSGFMYTAESSDDSDGFDEESKEAALTSEPDNGEAVLLPDSESDTEKQSRNSEAAGDNEAVEEGGTKESEGDGESQNKGKQVAHTGHTPRVDWTDRTQSGEVSTKYPRARAAPSVGIDDLRNKTERLYHASGTRRREKLPSKSVLIKGAAYLRKEFDNPDSEESLPLIFVHKKDEETRPRLCAEDATPAPRYVVERKDNTSQVSSRIAYLINNFNGDRPRALCYCLKNTYARSMTRQLNKNGVKAKALVSGDDESQTFRSLSSGYLDVVCVGADGKSSLIVHIYRCSGIYVFLLSS